MAYLGLVPCEHSSGASVRRGGLTKAGNSAARRLLIEAGGIFADRTAKDGSERPAHAAGGGLIAGNPVITSQGGASEPSDTLLSATPEARSRLG